MVATSNYAKHGNDPNALSISLWVPHFYKGREYHPLAPTEEILYKWRRAIATGNATSIKNAKEVYKQEYIKDILGKLDPETVLKDIGSNAILLCYESGTDFCHRHIVANWLTTHLGIEVLELPTKTSTRKKKGLLS